MTTLGQIQNVIAQADIVLVVEVRVVVPVVCHFLLGGIGVRGAQGYHDEDALLLFEFDKEPIFFGVHFTVDL
jgi:hypothetical protein